MLKHSDDIIERGLSHSPERRIARNNQNADEQMQSSPFSFDSELDDSSYEDSSSTRSNDSPLLLREVDIVDQTKHEQQDIDYDLARNVHTSQDIFETRLKSAATPTRQNSCHTVPSSFSLRGSITTITPTRTPIPVFVSNGLDRSVVCDPASFMSLWEALPSATTISCCTALAPSVKNCQDHFTANQFYVIASGVAKDQAVKLFLIAQCRGEKCLVEVNFSQKRRELNAKVKLEGEEQTIKFFMKCLNLRELFGDFIH
eukprot:7430532-Ditylum_brightwellii.AAC.1